MILVVAPQQKMILVVAPQPTREIVNMDQRTAIPLFPNFIGFSQMQCNRELYQTIGIVKVDVKLLSFSLYI